VMTLDSNKIEFDFDKADLRPQNRELLSRIVGVLLTFEDYGVQVFGHTDDVGTVEYNQQLSERRAEAVRAYLVEAGIEPAVLSTMGLGKSSPLVQGSDPQSRQRNRRVELAIVFSEGDFEAISEE
jgi:OOP family OmpA-OmpF porin